MGWKEWMEWMEMSYDDESAKQLFMEAKQVYQDRGMMKWIGFYLSDHTAVLNKESKQRKQVYFDKGQMSMEAIGERLQAAYLQNKRVAIQLEALDSEGQFFPDLVGKISGQKEQQLFLNEEERGVLRVEFEQIHHIELLAPKKILAPKE
ncbi:hypothetical protein P7H59_00435 [Enterococcus viikkiensis]|uniref:Uncharacterized protein n=1 Tax=Enterococcus viikkiensis TaxID=930854 RepID=A0ABU3FNM6_9ENTE|nr:hypothetical protein [Enterococcus viikkiensis]MDT2826914.1 hypothetical protein [Enterococcus viikkiensis]